MDVEKTIEFILANQAQFSADMLRMEAESAARDQRIDKLSENVAKHDEQIQAIAGAVHSLLEHGKDLGAAIERTHLRSMERDEEIKENLNALIKVVDGLVRRNGENGR